MCKWSGLTLAPITTPRPAHHRQKNQCSLEKIRLSALISPWKQKDLQEPIVPAPVHDMNVNDMLAAAPMMTLEDRTMLEWFLALAAGSFALLRA
jgi:hypothetical protein